MTTWTKKDEKTARAVLRKVADAVGGWQALATKMGLKDRAVPHKWQSRGRVPAVHCPALTRIANENGVKLSNGGPVISAVFSLEARALASENAQVAA